MEIQVQTKTKRKRKNKRDTKLKTSKEIKSLLIGMLIGDGTVSNNFVFKLSHCIQQKEYLQWKINLLDKYGVKNNGLKQYESTCGYNIGSTVLYSQLSITPFIKVLRKVFYTPKKNLNNRKLLNRLDRRGIAIWYMDDGNLDFRKTGDRIHGFYIKISTCESEETVQTIIDYFKEKWDISFYKFSEGKGTYSICCGTKEGIKFIDLIKEYVEEIPSMKYKITYDLSQRVRPL